MTKLPYLKVYPGDWYRGELNGLSLAAQGLWFRILLLMHDSEPRGQLSINGQPMTIQMMANRIGVPKEEVEILLVEMKSVGKPEKNEKGIIVSKRMIRDQQEYEIVIDKKSRAGKKSAELRWGKPIQKTKKAKKQTTTDTVTER